MYLKDIKSVFIVIPLCVLSVLCVLLLCERYEEIKWERSGIPDVVSTRNICGRCHITVVANNEEITDPDSLAENVIRMYRKNAFRSVRFSTDIGNSPDRVDAAVYRKKNDVGKKEPEFCFSFVP